MRTPTMTSCEPAADAPECGVLTVREAGRGVCADPDVLAWAAEEDRVLLTHDVTTMTRHTLERVARGAHMSGVVAVHQRPQSGDQINSTLAIGMKIVT